MFKHVRNLLAWATFYTEVRKAIDNPVLRQSPSHQRRVLAAALAIREVREMLTFLQGKKTYILVALGALVWTAQNLGYIDAALAQQLYALLGIGAVGTVKAKLDRAFTDR